ncbi:helix-turn-helix transcriptional regulator [Leeuwenhoekiella sp.]|uniref:helix-turn-helix domain-containing protein n=1 Tax=Leeuwenhoekiella sp. TaxID=1977054 RepID=UPI000C58DDF4|nr:helix-turn-helix transcriptional regulator [Leeuwenhoekiella sp.]MBA79888.1 transcriptional regulator [Leeuwenhoekiella sp.]|tara:strand:+ start:126 stop:383 length:258 start_codon:yes stop_codon:yes gene_type:complete
MGKDINTAICEYITFEWINPFLQDGGTQVEFADKHNILESTVRKIKGKASYRIPVETLFKICHEKGLDISDFFKLVEDKFPDLKP